MKEGAPETEEKRVGTLNYLVSEAEVYIKLCPKLCNNEVQRIFI